MLDFSELFVQLIKKILFSVAVEAIVTDHLEVVFWNMNEHLFEEIFPGFVNVNTFFRLVIVIEPVHFICFLVVGDNSAFRMAGREA